MKSIIKNMGTDGRLTLFLYGEVSDEGGEGKVSSREIVEALAWAESYDDCTEVLLRINSIGGDVYPGIAIFNAIRNSRKPVKAQVDGIAASIAGIITLAANKVEIGRYARMMLHAVSGGGYGNRQELQALISEIDQLEQSIAGIVSERTGQTVEEVRAAYFNDGKDHWFSAAEAVSLKLADSIYDEEPVPEGAEEHEIYNIFTNRLHASMRSQENKTMKLEKLKTIPRFANCANEEDALEEAAKVAEENEALKTRNEQLENENAQRQEEAIETTLEAAVKDGRIAEGDRETYKNLLKNDFTNAAKAIAGMKPKRKVIDTLSQGQPQNTLSPWEKRMKEIHDKRSAVK